MGMNPEMMEKKSGAEEVTWDLIDLYRSPDDPRLQRDRREVLDESGHFSETFRGRVAELTPDEFLEALREYERIVEKVRKIGSYAHLIWSTATQDPKLGKLVQEATELGSEVNQKLLFFDVEWLKLDEERATTLLESNELEPYRHYLLVSRRYKEHTLDEGQEQVLSAKSVTGKSAWVRFFDESMGAVRYRLDGEELTQQQVLTKLHSRDRELRKRAHGALSERLEEMSRTLTFVFNTLLADKQANDTLRNYKSWVHSRNLANQIEESSVEALVSSVTSSYPLVHRYYRLKGELLGYERMFDYDRYAPVRESDEQVGWEWAKEAVLTSFGKFHPEMEQIATRFFDKRWIDAAIRPGKRGGAYSASTVSSVHPYIFLNFDGTLRDVQTLAHELGHGVHQYLSRDRGELNSSTPLTTAETASVFAEMLVFEKLMDGLSDPREKLSLLISKIDDTIATVFRQISMNRFEEAVHTKRRNEGELTADQFSECWIETQRALYGESVALSDKYRIWWSYIPHFLHTPGYVYAYAFGELLVLALYNAYKEGHGGFDSRYMEMLSAGGSDWPHNLVAKLGLDITAPDFWQQGLNIFEQMVERAEKLKQEIDSMS